MTSFHYVTVFASKPVPMGGLTMNIEGEKTFFFDSDNEALIFCNKAREYGCDIKAFGLYQTSSVNAAEANLYVFLETLDKVD